MICSMTAFARSEIKGSWGVATWEIRSVNHRYLETCIYLPDQLRDLESIVRKYIRLRLTRGKIECNLRFDVNPDIKRAIILNKQFAKKLLKAAEWIKKQNNKYSKSDPFSILRWPGVISTEKQNLDTISTELLSGLYNTVDDFIKTRKAEGDIIKIFIEQKLNNISSEIEKVRQQMPEILIWQREKLFKKLEEAKIQLDSNRLEQEIIMLTQRIDVEEELHRLNLHVKDTYKILTKKVAVGRRLDFIMQEFNRESNTLASKSINHGITESAIELKVLIEQIREQVQNVE